MKRSLVCKRDFIYLCSALRFDSSPRVPDFLGMMKHCIKPQGTWKGSTPTSGFLSLRKWYLQIWWEVAGGVIFWPEEQLKIRDRFQDVFKKQFIQTLRKNLQKPFNAKSLRQTCTKFRVTASPLSSTVPSNSEHAFSASEFENLFHPASLKRSTLHPSLS